MRATKPTSEIGPQSIARAGSPSPRRLCASVSRNAFAAALPACAPFPKTPTIDEKRTSRSSSSPSVARWRFQPPASFAASPLRRRAASSCASGASSIAIAAWKTPRSGESFLSRARENAFDVVRAADVGGDDLDAGTRGPDRGERLLCLRAAAAPPDEQERAGPALREPAAEREPEAAEPAGDDVRAVRAEPRLALPPRHDLQLLARDREHDLADVPRLRDLLQRLRRLAEREDLERREPVDAALDLADGRPDDLADERRLLGDEPVDAEREVGERVPPTLASSSRVPFSATRAVKPLSTSPTSSTDQAGAELGAPASGSAVPLKEGAGRSRTPSTSIPSRSGADCSSSCLIAC